MRITALVDNIVPHEKRAGDRAFATFFGFGGSLGVTTTSGPGGAARASAGTASGKVAASAA